jgi:hypothetical protein
MNSFTSSVSSDFYFSSSEASSSPQPLYTSSPQKYSSTLSPSAPFSQVNSNFQSMSSSQSVQSTTISTTDELICSPSPPKGRQRRQRRKSPTVILRMKKFRRMKANDRERHRMHLLNDALERLRLALPAMPQDQRLTKIETLRFAHNYIFALSQAVGVIKNLRNKGSVANCEDFRHCEGCEVEIIEGGKYVVSVGNVKIVLDAEGQLVDTVATRPATPPPEGDLDGGGCGYGMGHWQQQQVGGGEHFYGETGSVNFTPQQGHVPFDDGTSFRSVHGMMMMSPDSSFNSSFSSDETTTTTTTTPITTMMIRDQFVHHSHQQPSYTFF